MATATPVIVSASLTPNPAKVGETVLLQILAIDVQSIAQEESHVSNEFYAAEV